jgi:predicted ArsR family transcriptional regulator
MRYIVDMKEITIKEIAEKLGITQQAAKARLFRLGIKPDRLIGNTGIYNPAVVEKIRTVNSVGRPKKQPEKAVAPAKKTDSRKVK